MKAYKWIICIVLVVVIGAGVLFFGDFRSDDSTPLPPPVQQTTEEAESVTEFTFSAPDYCAQLTQILNAYRQRNGLAEWTTDESLSTAADTRAYECSVLQTKSHTRSDGSDWFSVLNIQDNYNYSEIIGISTQDPADMARSWIAGESVNAGLLSEEYTACGLGCAAVGSDVYVVMILYKP